MEMMYAGECHPGDPLTFSTWQDPHVARTLHFQVHKGDGKPAFFMKAKVMPLSNASKSKL